MASTNNSNLYINMAVEPYLNILSRIPDPDTVLNNLRIGRNELRKLESDDEISAALETRRDAVITTPWRIDAPDTKHSLWLKGVLSNRIGDILRGAWNAVPYGYSVIEVVYAEEDSGNIGIGYVQEKPLEWFNPTRTGGMYYTPPGGGMITEVDTKYKFLLTRRNASYKNPYGEALLSRVYWPWFFRMQGWSSWVKFLERFADPLLLGIVNDPQSFVDLLRGQGFQSVVAVSQGESVSTVTSSGGGEFERLDAACSKRIQKLILGQTLTTDIGNTGSYAAAQVHDSVRDDKRRSDCRLITPTVQRLINSLWELNNFEGEPPVFTLQDDVGLEAARAERDNALAQYGLLTFTEKYFIDKYDLRPGDFIIPDQTTSAPSAATKASATSRIFKLTDSDINLAAMATDKKPGLELIDDLIAGTMQESNSPIKEDLILEAIKASSGPADLEERLAILMDKKYSGNFSNLTAFTTMLENALYYANVIGYASAQ